MQRTCPDYNGSGSARASCMVNIHFVYGIYHHRILVCGDEVRVYQFRLTQYEVSLIEPENPLFQDETRLRKLSQAKDGCVEGAGLLVGP